MSEAVEESGSLADHEAQFSPAARAAGAVEAPAETVTEPEATEAPEAEETPAQKTERERDESGKFTNKSNKHRSQSQIAAPGDVPRIQRLTKEREEARERAAALEARLAEYERRSAEPRREAEPAARVVSAEFTEKEPTIEQFEKEADPYAAWIRAVNRYDRKKEAFEQEQQRIAGERQRVEADGAAYVQNLHSEYKRKADEFSAAHPDYNDLIAKHADWDLPALANAVILEHENGPQLVYNLLKRPEELAGLILLTDGKAVNEKTVALATRWLENRALDAQTGSPAPVVTRKPTPTPPNPVRTVPSGSADSDDIESMSLSSFEQKFHKRRR